MAIGEKLLAALESANKKPGVLARETGISKNTIYGIIKRDNEKVDFSIMEKIADNLGLPVEYFFGKQSPKVVSQVIPLPNLTQQESDIIKMFLELDEKAKARIENMVRFEYEQMKQ